MEGTGIPDDRAVVCRTRCERGDQMRDLLPGGNVLSHAHSSTPRSATSRLGWSTVILRSTRTSGAPVRIVVLRPYPEALGPRWLLPVRLPGARRSAVRLPPGVARLVRGRLLLAIPSGPSEVPRMFIVGRRRSKKEDDWDVPEFRMMYPLQDIHIPDAPGPKVFEKTALTDDELAAAVEDSPLLRFCEAQERSGLRRPPLALSVGHLALLLSRRATRRACVPARGTASCGPWDGSEARRSHRRNI